MARDVLSLGQVRIHSGSATREEAMKEAADILEAAGAVTSAYFDAMQQREETVSTYMGNELAIPHGTNETKHTILDSALSVVRAWTAPTTSPASSAGIRSGGSASPT